MEKNWKDGKIQTYKAGSTGNLGYRKKKKKKILDGKSQMHITIETTMKAGSWEFF